MGENEQICDEVSTVSDGVVQADFVDVTGKKRRWSL